MPYLLKTEPTVYSFGDLQSEGTTIWDGVSNPVAVKNLRGMKAGEQLVTRHAQIVDRATVELLGQITKCIVTAAPNLGDDRAHALDGRRVHGLPARRQRAEVGVRAAKIES